MPAAMRDDDIPDLPRPVAADSGDPRDVARVFQDAYDTHLDSLCRYLAAYVDSWEVAEELVNDVFLRLWSALDAGETIHHIPAYLYATARRRAIDYRRHQQVEARHRRQEARAELRIVPPDADRQVAADELTAAILRAIDTLPPRQREVILLKWRRQATQEEIGRELGIATKTVTEHFRRAAEHLRAILADFQDPL